MKLLTCSRSRPSIEMSAADNRPSSSQGSAPRSKLSSLLGRLQPSKAHLSAAVSDFYIKLHRPHHLYSPGDLVTGSIVLSTTRAMRITHITLTLSGIVMLFPGSRAVNYALLQNDVRKQKGNQSRPRGTPVFGSGGAKGVILFEEETVIVGEGRLGAGGLEVGFETEFPAKGLVSSLEFERGTISYQLTATLTRPTTLNPVMHTSMDVRFRERVDVAYFHPPKPLTLSIEPMQNSSRHRLKSSASSADRSNTSNPNSPQLSPTVPQQTMQLPLPPALSASTTPLHAPPPPPPPPASVSASSQSQNSQGSQQITPTQSHAPSIVCPTIRSARSKANTNSNSSSAGSNGNNTNSKFINPTATIELLKAGCLPGDVIPIIISIFHTKPVKSLSGVIVTLSRQGRFDTFVIDNPTDASAPLTAKSLTFSRSAIATFRKDLDQTISPLMVDPRTLQSVVRTSVRLPEDVFPTITNVPGGVVGFTYFIEVLVDLGGKLGQKGSSLTSTVAGGMNGSGAQDVKRMELMGDGTSSTRSRMDSLGFSTNSNRPNLGGFLDTHKLRRERGVISCTFEVVVGTCNSAPKVAISRTNTGTTRGGYDDGTSSNGYGGGGTRHSGGAQSAASNNRRVEEYVRSISIPMPSTPPPPIANMHNGAAPEYPYPLHAPPTPPEPRDEKSRIRMAEMQLLPSAPPPSSSASGSRPGGLQPSAPILLDALDLDNAGEGPSGPAAPQYRSDPHSSSESTTPQPPTDDKHELELRRLMSAASAPPMGPSQPPPMPPMPVAYSHSHSMEPSAPTLDDFDGDVPDYAGPSHYHAYSTPSREPLTGENGGPSSGDDKVELERQRLLRMASAPPVVRRMPTNEHLQPSAPVLDDDGVGVPLPRYER